MKRLGMMAAAIAIPIAIAACGDSAATTTVPADTTPPPTAPPATTVEPTTVAATSTTAPPDTTTTAPPTTTSSSTTTSTTTTMAAPGVTIDISFVGGSVKAAESRFDVPLGSTVTITVSSDVDDDIHLHGYDLFAGVYEGQAVMKFVADVPGIFELEVEGSHVPLAELQVS